MQCDSVITSSRQQATERRGLKLIHSCFHWYKNRKSRSRNVRVI